MSTIWHQDVNHLTSRGWKLRARSCVMCPSSSLLHMKNELSSVLSINIIKDWCILLVFWDTCAFILHMSVTLSLVDSGSLIYFQASSHVLTWITIMTKTMKFEILIMGGESRESFFFYIFSIHSLKVLYHTCIYPSFKADISMIFLGIRA